jgi:uncharacterized protein YndB with AHSA1/START domain
MIMKTHLPIEKAGGISDGTVRKATGQGWAEWFAILDRFDVRKHGHRAAARFLWEERGCSGWWSQMITVAYEQTRGLREVHQQEDGFTANISRTLSVPIARAFAAWHRPEQRRRWLPRLALTIRKSNAGKSLRMTHPDGTNVDVHFAAKGAAKCQVAVQHSKLADRDEVPRRKKFWSQALDRLKQVLARDGS